MKSKKKKIVLLTGNSLANRNTLRLFLESDLELSGAVIQEPKNKLANLKFLKIAIKKQGFLNVFFQIIERIYYKLVNNKKDQEILNELFDREEINKSLSQTDVPILYTKNYNQKSVVNWVKDKSPDILVIHTPYWVGKRLRDIVSGHVIGGHPGITPYYRGAHSPFWAIYFNEFDKIGYTAFFVDKGVDTGDIIFQNTLQPQKGDSYMTLSWRGMIEIYKGIIKILEKADTLEEIPRKPIKHIPENSLFFHPTIFQYLRYRKQQKKVR